ncbi:Hef nuclease (plasmid) [Tsukamurella tyrosinosolvens]|uniref:Helicase conserved C-terminal domain-containing protein n=1 Tax=Tsukamurella tyrosinosolvens TaxID=57704 RepID=A0A1H4UAK9_TSUTY|nr:DEAD/DEAH box helicase [Tsukamurella tyrosinosolvens]KXO92981.1 hypothetical protein AXK58_14015 [Tsukamurella tyrosinosolvens]SEC65737.1 Helicase conserved C-terminal domain-containing protein [Tsukamurella tyrosinosolvens]VEH94093.1 Hef nuclease [Tsukamurella tyrosinosolvens]
MSVIVPAGVAAPALRQRAPHKLKRHQKKAVGWVDAALARQLLVMACGTGKTLVGQHATAKLLPSGSEPVTVLLLVPNLNLLQQTFDEWATHAPFAFDAIAICSSLTRAEQKAVDVEGDLDVSELTVPATTDAATVAAFLRGNGQRVRVAFGTYQSLSKVIEAHADHKAQPWSVVVCDEAHRTAGRTDKPFGRVLHDTHVPAERRLFLTATPKVHKLASSESASASSTLLASMDNTALFGQQRHTLSVAEAIERKILSEYRVAVIGVQDAELEAATAVLDTVTLDGKRFSVDHVAAVVALSKAAAEHGLHAAIAFFNTRKSSKQFVEAFQHVHAARTGEWLADGTAEHIDGTMSTAVRRAAVARLANPRAGGLEVVSNVHCFSEGIDVPALDAVLFGESRGSQIDVVQCVGRAIRRNGDRTALIILAVRIGAGEDPETAVEESQFAKVRQAIAALADHDPRISEAMRVLVRDAMADEADRRRESGAVAGEEAGCAVSGGAGSADEAADTAQSQGDAAAPDVELAQRPAAADVAAAKRLIAIDVPSEIIQSGFTLRMLDRSTAGWETGMAELRGFVEKNGHARVAAGHVTDTGFALGGWVSSRRWENRAGRLSAERVAELEAIPGWLWSVTSSLWETGMAELLGFVEKNGHARVANGHVTDTGFALGKWVSTRRGDYRAGRLSAERVAELEAVPRWLWDAVSPLWENGMAELRDFVEQNGHARVANEHVTDTGFALGTWVSNRRKDYRAGRLSAERVAELETVPGWLWDAVSSLWENGMSELWDFVEQNGHARVANGHVTDTGFALGTWVSNRRKDYRAGRLSAERVAELEAVPGWVWDVASSLWETGMAELLGFVEKNGHVRVPQGYMTDAGFALGWWVSSRRKYYQAGRLSAERAAELEAVPGWVWDVVSSLWENGVSELRGFVEKNGHARVAKGYVSVTGFALGTWVNSRRKDYRAGRLSAERVAELEAVPGWIWDARPKLKHEPTPPQAA